MLPNFVFVVVRLKSFRPAQTIAWAMGCRIGGEINPGRNGRDPGEPIPFWPGSTSSVHGLVPTPPVRVGHPIPGAVRDLPLTRWTRSTRPEYVGRREMGDDMWRG